MAIKTAAESAAITLGCLGVAVAAPALAPYLATASIPFFGTVLAGIFKPGDGDSLGKLILNTAASWFTNLGASAATQIPAALTKDHNFHLERMLATAYLMALAEVENEVAQCSDQDLKTQADQVIPQIKARIKDGLAYAKVNALFPVAPSQLSIDEAFANRFSAEKVELMIADPETWHRQLGEEVEITLRRWLNERRAADDRTARRKTLAIPDSEQLSAPLNAYLRENLPPRIAHKVGELVKKEDFKESWIAFQRAHLQEIVRILNKTETTQDDIRRQLGDLAKRFEQFASSGDLVEALAAKLSEFLENVGLLTKGDMESLLDKQRNQLSGDFSALLAPIQLQLDEIQRQQRELADASGRPSRGIRLETGRAEAADERVRIRPTELLLPRYCIAPFVDRGGVRDSIFSWIVSASGRRTQGRIYVAPGGFGKTRLAIELLVRLESLGGWQCGFIPDSYGEDSAAEELSALMASGAAGVCVFVDHAESRIPKLRQLAAAALAAGNGIPLRILAFARSVESWWTGFAGESAPSAIFDPTPFDAIAAQPSDDDRTQIFEQSRCAFVDKFRALGLPFREQGTAVDLAGADRPLLIAAMAFLDAAGVDLGNRSVFRTLYEQERRQWQRLLQAEADDEVADLARAAAQVTLVKGTTLDGAKALLQADDADRRIARADVLVKLRRLYGVYWIRGDGVSAEAEGSEVIPFINEVEPDMLGEHMCIQVLEESGPSLVSATLRAALSGPPLFRDDAARILTVLARATHPNHDPGIRRGAKRAIASIATLVPNLTASQVGHLANSLPPRSIALSELAVVVARRLAEVAPADSSEAALRQRADTQSYLSARLSDQGHDADALTASAKAVKLHRELVDMNRREHLRGLAAALHLHSQNLISLGRRKEAVPLSEEAVELNREIAAISPEMLGPGLAESLRNLGEIYSTVGRKGDALKSSQDACTQFESLAAQDPDRFRPALAGALGSLGNRLHEMDKSTEAFEVRSKAVEIDRQLVAGNRDEHLSRLASALNNLSMSLFSLERRDEALAAILEAIKYHRELVDKNRGGHLLGLAIALQGAGYVHFDAGHQEQALAITNESIRLFREVVTKTGDAYVQELARTLCNLGTMQRKLGHFRDACRTFEEGAKLVRPLAIKFPEAYRDLFETLRDQYTQSALESRRQPLDSESAPASKRHPIPEGSTIFDEADRLLQVFIQADSRRIDSRVKDEDAQAENILATETAMGELWGFLTENSNEEMIAPIKELAAFLADLIFNSAPADTLGAEAKRVQLAELFLAVKRARVTAHPEDLNARGDLAHSLMKHADAGGHGAELLQELHELRKANPEDPTVRELDAIALYCESNNAAVRGDEALANLKLDELRDLSTRHSKDADVRAAFAKTLEINGKCAIDKGDVASRDARLNELRSLVLAFPDDGSVRLVLAEVLFAAGAAGRLNGSPADEFFAELYSMVTAHPDDNPLTEFFNARFRTSSPGSPQD